LSTLLQVTDLRTIFHTDVGIVRAVDGVSFSLDESKTLGIVGESGSGKSVTMLSVMGLIPQPPGEIVSGTVLVNGRDLLRLRESEMDQVRMREISMIFQDPMTSLNPVLTIGRQLTEAAEIHLGMTPQQARNHAVDLLQQVGVPEAEQRLKSYPHQFSGGMRQRVMIAMAISCHPKILIADEPTTALDVTIQAQMVDLVKRLSQDLGMAVIWITHDLGVVAGLCDRVMVMYAGRMVESAPVDDLYYSPAHPYTLGLMGSLPKLNDRPKEPLQAIPGAPPDLIHMTGACAFASRCTFTGEACQSSGPQLREISPGHFVACWQDPQELRAKASGIAEIKDQ
jgi:oligopeptide transport system ATP-binding protein